MMSQAKWKKLFGALVLILIIGGGAVFGAMTWLEPDERDVEQVQQTPSMKSLADYCANEIGPARVEEVSDGVFVARGYDLANTILVRTPEGNVVVDVSMSPKRAEVVKQALLAKAPGPTRAIIYTHSHIDHIGGASVWMEEGTQVWATDAFVEHFLKQYTVFRPAESRRGRRQFGEHVDSEVLPCSGLGRRIDLDAALKTGVKMPTKTFSGRTEFEVGGVRFVLVEAHGETHDQLFVWLPQRSVLMPGDNYYAAFPNLYTIRGTSPRPVEAWVASLDKMRRLEAEHLVPSHTAPIKGAKKIRLALTRYRDGIQWVRDRVVQGANAGQSLDEIVESTGLPPSLAQEPSLRQFYGQIDWSVRAIYTNHLGWFDGRPEALYPPERGAVARKSVEMMGGAQAVWEAARRAVETDPKFATYLLGLLRDGGAAGTQEPGGRWAALMARALDKVASDLGNTNGVGYLRESAHELREGRSPPAQPTVTALIDAVPIEVFFETMGSRIIPERAVGVHEVIAFEFTDTDARFWLTIRNGVVEVAEGEAMPGSIAPLASVKTTTVVWRRLMLKDLSPAEVVADGRLKVEGDTASFYTFVRRFQARL